MNLFDELTDLLSKNGKTVSDIDWVRCAMDENEKLQSEVSVDDFISAAKNTNYDENSCFHELNETLKIFGKDRSFVIVVDEYDGRMSLKYISTDDKKPFLTSSFDSFYIKPDENSIAYRICRGDAR